MTNEPKREAELNLGVNHQAVDEATKHHRLKTEIQAADDIPERQIQNTLNRGDVTYQKLATSNIIDLDDYKFYYACLVVNAVAREQENGRFLQGMFLVNQGVQKLVEEHDASIYAAHGVLSMAFHARDHLDTHNIAQHLIQAVREPECPPLLRKRLADMGYTTPPTAGIDECGDPYYQWKGKNGIAARLGVRKRTNKTRDSHITQSSHNPS